MYKLIHRWSVLLALIALLLAPGCSLFSALHPSNTWKLNRGPAMDTGDVYFSVSDPAATLPRESAD
jgi:hypothetical protein